MNVKGVPTTLTNQNFSIGLSNTCKHRINVYLEPWGEVYELESDKKLQVDAVGPIGVAPNNMLEIRSCEDGITIWGWGGSGVTVHELEGQ
jgi:hypothetical protein